MGSAPRDGPRRVVLRLHGCPRWARAGAVTKGRGVAARGGQVTAGGGGSGIPRYGAAVFPVLSAVPGCDTAVRW